MRYQQWRLLLLRSYHRSHLTYSTPCSQVTSISTRSFSSFIHIRSAVGALQQSEQLCPLRSPVTSSGSLLKSVGRSFSSEPAVEEKSSPEAILIDIFSRLSGEDEIRKELESSDVVISQDLALKVLRKLESNPDVAKKVFQWFKEAIPEELSSKNYNMMLRILGGNGLVDEFWGLVDAMKKKGHGLSANVRDKVGEKFQKDGLETDLVRLKKLFSLDCLDDWAEKVCDRVCKIVMKEEWSDDVEKRLKDLMNVEFKSYLVKMIVESLDVEPRKALLFFRWIDESGLFKHNEQTYNAVARVLGKDKFLDRFQNIVEEMRSVGYEVEIETYVRVSTRFCQTKLIKEAVDLFEIAMVGSSTNKPTPYCVCLLLKKIVTAKILDMDLFSRAVKAYTRNGDGWMDFLLKPILKSLRSVDRIEQSNEVLKEMMKGDYFPSSNMQSMIASSLSRKGKKEEADKFVDFMEASGKFVDYKAMTSLVEGYCESGDFDEALVCFGTMIEKAGVSYAGFAFEKLVLAYCNKNQARVAYKLLSAQINQNQLKPRQSTYKILVTGLLKKKIARDGGFEEALSLLPIMKDHGYPPFLDPFMNYISTTGKSTEALGFLKAMTSKNFPSMSVVLRVFETMFKSARHSEAQDLLSLCPNYIRNNADVLELFNSMKPNESAVEKPLAASASASA